jgi:hypothetical protein
MMRIPLPDILPTFLLTNNMHWSDQGKGKDIEQGLNQSCHISLYQEGIRVSVIPSIARNLSDLDGPREQSEAALCSA